MSKLPKLLSRSDTLQEIYYLLHATYLSGLNVCIYAAAGVAKITKTLLVDITAFLNRLPLGNWISCFYLASIFSFFKSIVCAGELSRLVFRAIHLYFVDGFTAQQIKTQFNQYIWRQITNRIELVETWLFHLLIKIWDNTGATVKKQVVHIATELIVENADEIGRQLNQLTKTAAVAAAINHVSQEMVEAFMRSGVWDSTIQEMREDIVVVKSALLQNSADVRQREDAASLLKAIDETTAMILEEQWNENAVLREKVDNLLDRIEYLRVSHPNQFIKLIHDISVISSADTKISTNIIKSIYKVADLFSSSASQQGRRRIEMNI